MSTRISSPRAGNGEHPSNAPVAREGHRAAGARVSGGDYRIVVENAPTPAQARAMVAGAAEVLGELLRLADRERGGAA